MMSKSVLLIVAIAVASAQAGLLGPAIVAPYASSFNAHHINHAVAHPLLAPAPVAPAVFAAPAPPVFAAPAPAVVPAAAPAPAVFAAPAPVGPAPVFGAPGFLPGAAPLAYSAGFPAALLGK